MLQLFSYTGLFKGIVNLTVDVFICTDKSLSLNLQSELALNAESPFALTESVAFSSGATLTGFTVRCFLIKTNHNKNKSYRNNHNLIALSNDVELLNLYAVLLQASFLKQPNQFFVAGAGNFNILGLTGDMFTSLTTY